MLRGFKVVHVFDIAQTDGQELPQVARRLDGSDGYGAFDRLRAVAALVGYIVMSTLGLDSGAYSFGYVATWAGGGEAAIEGIKQSGARIQRTAQSIIEALERTEGATS